MKNIGYKKHKDIAENNIRKKNGKYYDLCKDSLVNVGKNKLSQKQFLHLFKRFRIRFNLTPQCNLWCIFCSNEGSSYATKHQKSADIKKIISLSNILIKNTPIQSIEFSGGEPTIHSDFISKDFKLIKWTKKHPQIKFAIHSNGVLLTPEVIDQIKDNFFKIGLSIHSVNYKTWNKITNFKNYFTQTQQKEKFKRLMTNIDYIAKCNIGEKIFIKSVVIRGINDSEKELKDLLDFCTKKGFHPKFFEFEPQYKEQEKYVVGRKELFSKLEKLGCHFTVDTPRENDPKNYIPSVNFDYEPRKNPKKGLHSIFGCGEEGACKSCYINLPIFIKATEDGKGLYIKPCSTLDTRFDLSWAIKTKNEKEVLNLFKMAREYLMLMPGLGINEWNKEDEFKIDFT